VKEENNNREPVERSGRHRRRKQRRSFEKCRDGCFGRKQVWERGVGN